MARRLSAKTQPAPIGDNSGAIEEGQRVQFLSVLAKLEEADAKIEEARAPLKAAQGVRKQVIGLAKAAGIPEWRLKQRQDELKRTTSENAANIAAEAQERRWAGIITPEQMSMHLDGNTPQEAIDEADAEAEGYKAALRGLPASPPEKVGGRFVQPWLRGHERGLKSKLEAIAAHAPGAQGRTETVAEQAAREFREDNPDAPEPGTPEAAKLEREAIRKAKESLANMQAPDDGFEASPEELAAQAGRPSVEDAVV